MRFPETTADARYPTGGTEHERAQAFKVIAERVPISRIELTARPGRRSEAVCR